MHLVDVIGGDPAAVTTHLARAWVLTDQRRDDLAEAELRRALAADPTDPRPHAYLSFCLSARGRHGEARDEAETAVRLDPEWPDAHAALANVLLARGRATEALAAISEAIRLAPDSPDFRAKLADIHFNGGRPSEALATAETGLALDVEHTLCAQLRALALLRLGRPAEAASGAAAVIRREADNAILHAIRGWALLQTGDRAEAEVHLRAALRLDPGYAWARDGLAQALRARYPGYRRPSLSQNRPATDGEHSPRERGQVRTAGFWLALILAPLLVMFVAVGSVLWVLGVTVRGTWRLAADTAAALRLRRDPLGRHLYPPSRLATALWEAACGYVSLAALVAAIASGHGALWLNSGLGLLLLVPLAGAFYPPRSPTRPAAVTLATALAAGGMAVLLVAHG